MANILAVDDDIGILDLLYNTLSKSGHYVKKINDSQRVLDENLNFYQLIILDIMMPGMDGYELCKRIREQVDYPIMFLTAKTNEADIIKGLGLGADDYLTKPFSIMELRARVDAHLRREQREKVHSISIRNIRFSLSSKECFVSDNKVPLTRSEYDICEYLALNHGQIFSKEQIYEYVFGFEKESNISAIVEHIKNIRAKLNRYREDPIKTVWGVGYKWS